MQRQPSQSRDNAETKQRESTALSLLSEQTEKRQSIDRTETELRIDRAWTEFGQSRDRAETEQRQSHDANSWEIPSKTLKTKLSKTAHLLKDFYSS